MFDAVWKVVNEKYFDAKFNGVDWVHARETFRPQAKAAANEQELYRVTNRMLGELRDRHTFALSPTEVLNSRRSVSLNVGLIGKVIEDRVIYTRVLAGSSAQAAGVQPGWILTRVAGVPADASRFRGFAVGNGERLRLTFLDAQDQVREVELLARPFADVPEQSAKMLDGGTLYIRFESFYIPEIGKWFKETLARHREARALIIDLRGNWGGPASELQECLAQLYARPAVFGEFIGRGGEERLLRVAGRGREAFAGKVVVLIDEDSFSSAELFAAAVQESGRGLIVGRTSKGSALNSVEEKLPDGGRLYLSIRDYRTGRGRRIEGRGVQPDAAVSLKLDDLRRNIDRDLERALQLVR